MGSGWKYFQNGMNRGHTGNRPERAIGSLLASPSGWNKLATATLSWLSFIPSTLSHLVLLSRSLGNRWKEAQGGSGSGCGHNSLRIFWRTASFSIVPQPILTLRMPSLTSRSPVYHCGHLNCVNGIVVATSASQTAHLAILPFITMRYKRATGCDVRRSMRTFVCVQLVYCVMP